MNTLLELFQAIEYISALAVIIFGVFFALNKMSHCTRHDIRVAWLCLTAGAMAIFLWPPIAHPLLLSGVAIFVVADKRRCLECDETRKESLVEFL